MFPLDRPCPALMKHRIKVLNQKSGKQEVTSMANIKSAKKRILVNRTKADRNKAIKSGVKTAIKKVYTAVDANDKAVSYTHLTLPTKRIV